MFGGVGQSLSLESCCEVRDFRGFLIHCHGWGSVYVFLRWIDQGESFLAVRGLFVSFRKQLSEAFAGNVGSRPFRLWLSVSTLDRKSVV